MKKRTRKIRIPYSELTENKKDKILDHIRVQGVSIREAAKKWNITTSTLNKIFTERFGSRERKIAEMKNLVINKSEKKWI